MGAPAPRDFPDLPEHDAMRKSIGDCYPTVDLPGFLAMVQSNDAERPRRQSVLPQARTMTTETWRGVKG